MRHVEDNTVPLPFVFSMPDPPLRLPAVEGADGGDADRPKQPPTPPNRGPNGRPARRKLGEQTDRPVRVMRCAVDRCAGCPKCGGALKGIGTSHTHRPEWVPGILEILDVQPDRCVCPSCRFAGALGGAEHLQRLADAIEARLLASRWLQADDTGFPVQDGSDGTLRKGRLWALTDQREVRYPFTDTKEGQNPARFLATFQGKLRLVDGGSDFNLAVAEKGLLRAGCWSHLGRYFFDARHHHPAKARLARPTIRDLFAIEDGLDGAPLDVIHEVRQRDARPLVAGLYDRILGLRLQVRPSSLPGEALTYAVNGREFFERFLDHPEVPMHNNAAKLRLRGPVVGRKQWPFAGSKGGAHAAATMFTLFGSCMLQGIDP